MKKIYVEPANVGNLMFRLMFAEHLRRQVPGSIITGAGIPEWGLLLPDGRPRRHIRLDPPGNAVDVAAVVRSIQDPGCDGVVLNSYGLRLEYFEHSRDLFLSLFQTTTGGQVTEPDELVIHVRAGDILGGVHPDYNPVPISYYRSLVERTGLKPVFSGQTGPSVYMDAIRGAFPNARFLRGNHWLDDFQTTRNARNIVISVGTFSWLAAWLSETAERIYLPRLGLLNPLQRPDVDLCPVNDSRYIFEDFPIEKYEATPGQIGRIIADPPAEDAQAAAPASWTDIR